MPLEVADGVWRKRHRPPRSVALGVRVDDAAARESPRAPDDMNRGAVKVDVLPAQGQQLAYAGTSGQGDVDQRMVWTIGGFLQEAFCVLGVQHPHFGPFRPRAVTASAGFRAISCHRTAWLSAS